MFTHDASLPGLDDPDGGGVNASMGAFVFQVRSACLWPVVQPSEDELLFPGGLQAEAWRVRLLLQ